MNDELIAYYENLLIIQYHDKPKAQATIVAYIAALMIYDIAIQVRDAFNLDTATGIQLDTIGKYLGASRIIYGQSFTRNYWGFHEYGTIAPFAFYPFRKYGDPPVDVQIFDYRYSNESLYALNDTEYLLILRLKIIKNNAIPSPQLIDQLNEQLFNGQVIFTDRQNMTIGFIFNTASKRIAQIAESEDLFPRPSGVALALSFTNDITNIFSFQQYGGIKPDFAVGFKQYGVAAVGGWRYYG